MTSKTNAENVAVCRALMNVGSKPEIKYSSEIQIRGLKAFANRQTVFTAYGETLASSQTQALPACEAWV